ncbi:MAG TPA: heparinase II/III family protein [Bacteroidales bacterium]|nr:heparinase II/III family protein [Bacteroidales bacterium]HPJ58256.1 heparinase II/III family protein [Bacteroidales bacterium]HRW85422.1 heparinase II/III family protein [Bacteroidales bacterium]
MKSKHLLELILLISVIFFYSCKASESTIPGEPPSHPRILLLKGEEALVDQTIAADRRWLTVSSFIIDQSEAMLDKPPVERVLTGRRLLSKSREALKRIYYLSYSYRKTADNRFLARAEEEMLAVAAFSDWNPSHFLDVAEMTMAMAIGYDWLYENLTEESKSVIKEAIVEKGLKPSLLSQNSGWAKNSNNWNQVCNAGMVFGALAVYEDEKDLALKMIERAVTSTALPMEDYNPDGAYPEGYGYWGYGTSFHVMFLSAMEKAFGDYYKLPSAEGFMKTAGYLENMTGPFGMPFNYSDCGSGANTNPAMYWFAARLKDPSVLWSERYFLNNKTLPADRLLPSLLVWSTGIITEDITPPSYRVWTGQGKNPVALMRTGWNDKNDIFVGFKAGSPYVNHGHMDVGSFIMDANGERWAMDFGSQDYNSLETAGVDLWNRSQNSERWTVFRYNNRAHNTLTVNDKLQNVTGNAIIGSHYEGTGMLNAISDITGVYSGQLAKAVRGIAIVDDSYVMVRDEVETTASTTLIRWNLLTSADVTITGSKTAELVKNGKKMILKVVQPANVTMKTWSTVSPNSYDAANPGTIFTGFEATLPASAKISLVVLLLPEGAVENESVTSKNLSVWPSN